MSVLLLIVLRLVHVVAGILWGGAAVYYLFFVKPSVKAISPTGSQFMQSMTERRKMPLFMVGTNGQTTETVFVATEIGQFHYYCTVSGHRQMGMEGKLIVNEP